MHLKELEGAIRKWLAEGATDIFLSVDQPARLRINGEVVSFSDGKMSWEDLVMFWRACGTDPEQAYERDLRHPMQEGGYLRVNLYRAMGKISAAIRPIKNRIPRLEDLGVPSKMLREWSKRGAGIVLVTGPTGSGKSTTLASILNDVNQRARKHIVTIEDPIEYIFENDASYFSQREVNSDTHDFGGALRSSLRQNPDIIMIGEIRDEESAQMALRAAETGHLVLSTLHSSGVVETMERLTNLFPTGKRNTSLLLLSKQLIGVTSQLLLPGVEGTLQLVNEYFQNEGATRMWIREGRYREMIDFLQRGGNENTRDQLSDLVRVHQEGLISKEVARSGARNPSDFDRIIRGIL